MTLQRLIVQEAQVQGQTLSLTSQQQHYLRRVLRLRAGDRFLTLDGKGRQWMATLAASGAEAILSAPLDEIDAEQKVSLVSPLITLAACLPKQGFDEVVRQVTELGVNQIVPILSDRTLLRPSLSKQTRWQRIANEAAEQSERLTVPTVKAPTPWSKWLLEETESDRYLCIARRNVPSLLTLCLSTNVDRIVVAVGPEGGWTDHEVELALMAGYELVTLGRRVLRAVTASVAALSILQIGFESANIETYQVKQP